MQTAGRKELAARIFAHIVRTRIVFHANQIAEGWRQAKRVIAMNSVEIMVIVVRICASGARTLRLSAWTLAVVHVGGSPC
mmetsp:Transcript_34183/g.43135  ORF Transcript_34183/g.43135 Transcript_34183/m.43135 type:complete len:80 (-) Transcript_34183:569-808(-)